MNLIIAGNYPQAVNFAREKEWRPCEYSIVTYWRQVAGVEKATAWFVGTWRQLRNLRDIQDRLFCRRGIVCVYPEY